MRGTRALAHGRSGAAARTVRGALASSTFLVTATAHAVACSLAAGGLAFPSYDVFSGTANTVNSTIRVTCNYQPSDNGAITVNYTLSLSTGSSNSYVQRTMTTAGDSLGYNIFTANTYSVVWGDGTGGSSTQGGSMKVTNGHPNQTDTFTAYGRIPPLQDARVGSYTDGITITVNY